MQSHDPSIDEIMGLLSSDSSEMPSPGNHTFLGYLCNYTTWIRAYKKVSRQTKLNDRIVRNMLETMTFSNGFKLEEIFQQLRDKTYEFQRPERKPIPKPGGKNRTIYYYPGKVGNADYMILYIMQRYLSARYDHLFAGTLFSYRPKFGVKGAVSYLKKQILEKGDLDGRLGYKADVSKYFHSVDKDLLLKDLRRTISPNACIYLEKILRTADLFEEDSDFDPPGIYAGLPIGPFLANFYLRKMDWYFLKRDITYCRFADDILLFADSDKERENCVRYIKRFLDIKHLEIQPKKEDYYPGPAPLEFLGLRFSEGKIDLNTRSYERRKTKIRMICKETRRTIGKIVRSVPMPNGVHLSERQRMESLLKDQPKEVIRGDNRFVFRYPSPLYQPISSMMKQLDRAHFGPFSDHSKSFMGWYYGLINTDETLKKIDQFCLQEIRYAITGKRGLAAAKIVPYRYLKEKFDYHPLVSEWRRSRYFKG